MNPPLSVAQANYLNLPRSGPFVALDELAAIGAPVNPVFDFELDGDDVTLAVRSRLSSGHPAPRSH
jgi:hypothetical protein